MTIALAVKNDTGIWLASDARITAGTIVASDSYPKWLRLSARWWLGFAGLHRSSMLISNLLKPTSRDSSFSISEKIKKILSRDGYFDHRDESGPKAGPDTFILVDTKQLAIHQIDAVFGSHEVVGYTAIGSGSDFSLGCLYAQKAETLKTIESTQASLILAIEAACKFDITCGGTVFIKHIGARR